MQHVFISYIRENEEIVDKLCEALESHGIKVWLDRNDIDPGSRWKQAIREAIREGLFSSRVSQRNTINVIRLT